MNEKLLKLIAPVLFVGNLAVILVIWWQNAGPEIQADSIAGSLVAFGRLAGLLAFYMILWQIMLIGRVGWIERAWGHDKLSRWHHFCGIVAIGILFFHPILLTLGYSKLAGTGLFSQFWLFITNYPYVVYAFVAYLLFLSILVFTLVAIGFLIAQKKLRYETWYYVHVTLYLAILLAFLHQPVNGHDLVRPAVHIYWDALLAFTLINVGYYRFARPWLNFRKYQFRVERVEVETDNVNSVVITGQHLEQFKAQAGQFIIVRFLAKGFWWEAHPFTLSEKFNGQRLRITPKAVGDFTRKIPTLSPSTRVFIEGPLGLFIASRATQQKILLIAGGIGITPLRSLFEEFAQQDRDVGLLYAARSEKDFALKIELDRLSSPQARVHYLPEDKVGRLTSALIKQIVPDVAQRFIFLCGPPPMMKAVREQLLGLGLSKRAIIYEKFQLG